MENQNVLVERRLDRLEILPVFTGGGSDKKTTVKEGGLAADEAYHIIRGLILNLGLRPGALIDTARLMERYGLGRTPIREALKKLEVEHLVTSRPRQGTYVSDIGLSDFAQIYQVRRHLCHLAVQLLAGPIDSDMGEKTVALFWPILPGKTVTMEGTVYAILRFYYKLADMTGNDYLRQALGRYCAYTQRIWLLVADQMSREDFHLQDLRKLMEMIETGKGAQAGDLILEHMEAVHTDIRRYF